MNDNPQSAAVFMYRPEPAGSEADTATGGMVLKKQKTKEYDRARHSLMTPISRTKYCVLYITGGKEKRSPWFYSNERAQSALTVLRRRFGDRNAILFRD